MAKENYYTFIQMPPGHSKSVQQDMLFIKKISEEDAASQKDYEYDF